MKKKLKITEEDLDTTPNLSTLNYLLGLIGLKDSMDMRVFSRNFIKIDELLKNIFDGIANHIKVLASKTQHGHMSKEDKAKLDGVDVSANNYKLPNASTSVVGGIKVGSNLQIAADGTLSAPAGYSHPTSPGNKHIPSGGAANNFIKWASDGTGAWGLINWDIIQNKPSSFTPATHTHDDRYFTEGEINEKFKNFCPFPVNSVFILLDNSNPAILFPGTTWQKQEGRFLQGTSGSETPGTTGGVSSVALTTSHMPAHDHTGSVNIIQNGDHRHQVDNHIHTQPPHVHTYERFTINANASAKSAEYTNDDYKWQSTNTSSGGGDNTGGATPYTNTTGGHGHSATLSINKNGSGSSFSIIPPYLKVNIWKRLT